MLTNYLGLERIVFRSSILMTVWPLIPLVQNGAKLTTYLLHAVFDDGPLSNDPLFARRELDGLLAVMTSDGDVVLSDNDKSKLVFQSIWKRIIEVIILNNLYNSIPAWANTYNSSPPQRVSVLSIGNGHRYSFKRDVSVWPEGLIRLLSLSA